MERPVPHPSVLSAGSPGHGELHEQMTPIKRSLDLLTTISRTHPAHIQTRRGPIGPGRHARSTLPRSFSNNGYV